MKKQKMVYAITDKNNMKAQKASYHLSNDRIDRAMIIYERLGWDIGREILCVPFPDNSGRIGLRALTDKGVVVCKNIETKVITTIFVATPGQVRQLYGNKKMPDFISHVIFRNQSKFSDIIG